MTAIVTMETPPTTIGFVIKDFIHSIVNDDKSHKYIAANGSIYSSIDDIPSDQLFPDHGSLSKYLTDWDLANPEYPSEAWAQRIIIIDCSPAPRHYMVI